MITLVQSSVRCSSFSTPNMLGKKKRHYLFRVFTRIEPRVHGLEADVQFPVSDFVVLCALSSSWPSESEFLQACHCLVSISFSCKMVNAMNTIPVSLLLHVVPLEPRIGLAPSRGLITLSQKKDKKEASPSSWPSYASSFKFKILKMGSISLGSVELGGIFGLARRVLQTLNLNALWHLCGKPCAPRVHHSPWHSIQSLSSSSSLLFVLSPGLWRYFRFPPGNLGLHGLEKSLLVGIRWDSKLPFYGSIFFPQLKCLKLCDIKPHK